MRRVPALALSFVLALLFMPTAVTQAQYAIPDCFVASVNSTFPQQEYWASRDAWYRELGSEWNGMVAGLTPAQITAYTSVFCSTLHVFDRGDSEDGQSRLVEWSYLTVEGWFDSTGGSVPQSPPATTGSGDVSSPSNPVANTTGGNVVTTATTTTDDGIYSTDFDTLPPEIIIMDADNNVITGRLTPNDGDSALRMKVADYATLYYDDGSLTDYALEVDARIYSGELMLTVRGGDDFCSGYDFGFAPFNDYAYLRVTDENCQTTVVEDMISLGVESGDNVTLRLAIDDSRLTAYVNGQEEMSATVRRFTEGHPALFFFSEQDPAQKALIDIAALRITSSTTPVVADGTLTQHTAAHGQAIAELQALGIVPNERGTFIFQEPTAYFEGDGSWYTPLAESAPHTNIVMAGNLEVTFNAPSEYEACKLMTRIVTVGNTAVQDLSAGIDSDGDVFLVDSDDPDASSYSTFEYTGLNGDLDISHHVMIVAMGNLVSLYVDGELYFDRVKIDERAGTYGIGLSSHDGDSRCEANNLWVYSFD